ncbi:helicase [Pantoea sp. B9002]|uniref:helicase n=1 Tax=Pantoea sp. B9002 TaxID=2726979 RepID=UPI0015A28DA3|nr:helicase [Pantoea sp. B9002]NWA62878.1 helicase [Pantoea sp. B9002]
MYDNKSLQDKQLIRSIADLVIQNPSRAREIFGNLDKIVQLYPELSGVRDLVLSYLSENYLKELSYEINGINDKTTKNIFMSALNSYINSNKYKHIS